MNTYIILIIVFAIIIVLAGLALAYFLYDEKKLKEVDPELLVKLGKRYTKEEFETTMFNRYIEIVESIQNENYNLLRDVVADEEYNKILLKIKENKDRQQREMCTNFKKGFSKLVSFRINSDVEVAKLWIQYTDNEYIEADREVVDDKGETHIEKTIIKGDKKKDVYHEYILTFVKGRTNNEDILCPNCGNLTNIALNNRCLKCDSVIAPKKMHWVYVDKVVTNISKIK